MGKIHQTLTVFTVAIGMCLCVPTSAFGQDMVVDFFEGIGVDTLELEGSVIGLGVLYSTEPYTDVDANVYPVPIVNLEYKRFFISGTSFGFHLTDNEAFNISLIGAPRFWGYEPDDSSALIGMTKRSGSFDGGVRASWENELCTLDVTFLTDLTGEHEGQEVSAFIKHEFLEGGFTPRVGVQWYSEDLVDHYFGVESGEVTATRPAYSPDSTVDVIIGATIAIPLGDKWAWVTDGQYQFLGDEIEDSPIVDEDGVFRIVSGIVYRF